jgi:hypothetical protein
MFRHKSYLLLGLFAAFALLLFVINPVRGQSILYGKLTGTITDDTGVPLPGVTVEITSDALIGGPRSSITSEKGTYAFLNLPVGKYRLTATLQGFKTAVQEDITINADTARVLDITMTPGVIEEQVTVTAVAPIMDPRSSTTSTRIDETLLEKMPTTRDAFYDLTLTAPGMMNHGNPGATGWMPSPNAYGGASNENVFLLNGVNSTSPQGSAFGSLLRVNYNAVEEVRLIALGSKSEYGAFSGVAIDVLTKSGGNEFHGNVAVYSNLGKSANNQPDPADLGNIGDVPLRIIAEPGTADVPAEIREITSRNLEGSFSLGGPIFKDKLWFYGGADYSDTKRDTPIWPYDETWKGFLGDIKLTAAPWSNHRAWIAYHFESNSAGNGTWSRDWDPTANYGRDTIRHSISAQWQWMPTGKTILTAKYLGFWDTPKQTIPDDAPEWPIMHNWWKWYRYGVGNGCFSWFYRDIARRNTLQADISHYAEDFLGEHDIKFGVQLTNGSLDALNAYFRGYTNGVYPERWCGPYVDRMTGWYGDTGAHFYSRKTYEDPYKVVRTNDGLGFFIDDQWTPTKRLTINLGLRYDHMTSKYGKGAIWEWPGDWKKLYEPMTLIEETPETENVFDFKTVSPRIGITYALTSDMKTIFRASYGRYYLPLAAEYLKGAGPYAPIQDVYVDVYSVPWSIADADGNQYVDFFEATNSARAITDLTPIYGWSYTQDPSWQWSVAEDLKNQYTDQITVNLERELLPNFSASLTYIYKNSENLYAYYPINTVTGESWEYEKVPWTSSYGYTTDLYSIVLRDYNGDGTIDQNDIGWIADNGDVQVRNLPEFEGIKPHRTYHGLQLVLRKHYSNRWQMLGSFLYSSSDGLGRRSLRTDFNFEGPMITNDYFAQTVNLFVNNMEGPLPWTSKYEFKLSGSYLIPRIEADFGFRFRWNSGRPFWPCEAYPMTSRWAPPVEGYVTSDDTAWTKVVAIDVKDPWYYPSEAMLDLRLAKDFRIGGRTLNVALDVLNAFNTATPSYIGEGNINEVGIVTAVTIPTRTFRLNIRFNF